MSILKTCIFALCMVTGIVCAEARDYYVNLPCKVAKAEVPNIPDATVSIADYGAVGDGTTLCTAAIQKAVDDIAAKGGGHVLVPEGAWVFTSIQLKSNIDLHLDDNALMLLSHNKTLFQKQPGAKGKFYPGIWADNSHDVSITGGGVIDGNGKYWRPVKRGKMSDTEWDRYMKMGGTVMDNGKMWYPFNLKNATNINNKPEKEQSVRSNLVEFTNCQRVRVEDVTVQNSPRFHVHPLWCSDVTIEGITVRCPWNAQNGDGIDVTNCQRVLIAGCTVDVGDDGICLKGRASKKGEATPSEDILIDNNKLVHAHGGFVFGSNIVGGMTRVVVRHCTFSSTDTGLRFKSAIDRGGRTKDVYISDIMMNDINNEAITVTCDYDNKPKDDARQYIPDFTDIHIDRVRCGEARVGLKASGIDGYKCVHDIKISNSKIICTEATTDIDSKTAAVDFDKDTFVML